LPLPPLPPPLIIEVRERRFGNACRKCSNQLRWSARQLLLQEIQLVAQLPLPMLVVLKMHPLSVVMELARLVCWRR
jgi:hypothetical protein